MSIPGASIWASSSTQLTAGLLLLPLASAPSPKRSSCAPRSWPNRFENVARGLAGPHSAPPDTKSEKDMSSSGCGGHKRRAERRLRRLNASPFIHAFIGHANCNSVRLSNLGRLGACGARREDDGLAKRGRGARRQRRGGSRQGGQGGGHYNHTGHRTSAATPARFDS